MSERKETISRPKLHHINLKTTRLQEMVQNCFLSGFGYP
jgi:hypothetical protein